MAYDYMPRELQRERIREPPLLTPEQVERIVAAVKSWREWNEEEDDERGIDDAGTAPANA